MIGEYKAMDLKDYHKEIEPKLSFEEWKANLAPSMPEQNPPFLWRCQKVIPLSD
jgi:hypothetical protein